MNWFGSGFVTIINYGSFAEAIEESFVLLTEDGNNLFTEDGNDLLIESAIT